MNLDTAQMFSCVYVRLIDWLRFVLFINYECVEDDE